MTLRKGTYKVCRSSRWLGILNNITVLALLMWPGTYFCSTLSIGTVPSLDLPSVLSA